jgi:hypothetical protein
VFLTLFVFFGTIGVDVFSHICNEDGVEVSYFVASVDDCDDHHELEKKSCCDEEPEDDCCTTEQDHLQLKLDYFHAFHISPVVVPSSDWFGLNFIEIDLPTVRNELVRQNLPPPDSGREILIRKQYWLI